MSAHAKRVLGVTLAVVVAGVLIGFYMGYLTTSPGSGEASAAQTPAGAQLYLATVPAAALSDPHPTWVSYYAGRLQVRQLASRHDLRAAGQHAGPRHDLPVRRPVGPAQLVHLAGDGHGRRRASCSTASRRRRSTPIRPRTCSRSRRSASRCRCEGIADDAKNPCSNAPCSLAMDHHHDLVHVPHAGARPVPLAVLRPLRRRLHPGLRRADADGRLHGRLHQGRVRGGADGQRQPLPPPGPDLAAGRASSRRRWSCSCSAPALPPGNGSVQASGQVVDNAVLLGVSTPVALAVLVYFVYALIAFRERDPERRCSTDRRCAVTRACRPRGSS